MNTPEFYEPDDQTSVTEPPYIIDPPLVPVEPDPPAKSRRGCWLMLIALLVIFSLLASALVSLLGIGEELNTNWVLPWTTPTPTLAEAGRIVYVDEKGQVVTVQANGEQKRQLTDDEFPYQFPAWSPDGAYLAVLGRSSIVRLTDTEESQSQTLYEGGVQSPFYLYWSPDSSQISFLANSQRGLALRVVAADGTGEAEIRGVGSPFYWNWLDDSSQMLVHTGSTGSEARLGLLQANGQVENIAPPGLFQAPGISANGRYWAYAEDMGNGSSWLVITDTENGEQWTERHPAVAAMSWSPAADQLAFITGIRDANSFWGPIRLFDMETGEVTLLSDNIVVAFFWSPNGRYLATINTGDINEDIGVNVADHEQPARRTQAKAAAQFNHQFNLAIIDVETGEESQVMSFYPTGIFISQFLPFFDQYALSHNIWSPNSDALVLPLREEGESRVKVVQINNQALIDLGQGDMAFWSR
jgi:TolB protein